MQEFDNSPSHQNGQISGAAKRVFIKTLGCKVNTFDGNAIGNQFKAQGYTLVDSPDAADITVLNTCSVTSAADREARYLIRRYRRENPDTKLVVTGCYAQTDSARLTGMEEVDFVVPNQAKEQLVQLVESGQADGTEKMPAAVKPVSENRQSHFKSSLTLFDDASSTQTRAFVKIQDGCNGFCAYCLIPYARGASRSVPRQQAFSEIERLIKNGTPEIVLTGIHIGDYGQDLEPSRDEAGSKGIDQDHFASFVADVMNIPGLRRLRISSLEPNELTSALLRVLKANEGKFCPHFHLPLQSGNDRVLKAMRRTYDTATYATAIAEARELFPDASFGADVIPGFPGETEEEFAGTMAFISDLKLSYLHVFPYSLRPNTAAARMPGHLPPEIVKERAARLRELSTKLAREYHASFVGKALEVLWEKDTDDEGRRSGVSRNYLGIVSTPGYSPAAGTIETCKVKGFTAAGKLLVVAGR
ncbi:MAG: hypothetical protein RIQ81_2559 [Pseudomonadota bacterium]|jgi:threonylcarbamoyladenosine tRNA methylthiotransferase MtaB